MILTLLLALTLTASAQSPMPYSGDAPTASSAPAAAVAASTDTTVAASTETAVAVSTGAAKAAVKPVAKPRLHAVIHPEAKNWEPLSLRAGGDPEKTETKVVLRLAKSRGIYKGSPSKATAAARLHRAGQDHWLTIAVFPKELEKRRRHFEIRLRLAEGFVEEAKAVLVTVVDQLPDVGAGHDLAELREEGVEFEEDSPASGSILISALDPRPSRSAVNSGTLKLAAFEARDVGLTDVSWSTTGLR